MAADGPYTIFLLSLALLFDKMTFWGMENPILISNGGLI